MKSATKFSIATLLMAIAIFAGYLSGFRGSYRIPREFEGVWEITSAVSEGNELKMANPDRRFLDSDECEFTELIFSDNRLFLVKTNGDAVACKVKPISGSNGMKLELAGFGYRAEQDGPTYCIAKRNGIDLDVAFVGVNDNTIDHTASSKQTVYTAMRPEAKKH